MREKRERGIGGKRGNSSDLMTFLTEQVKPESNEYQELRRQKEEGPHPTMDDLYDYVLGWLPEGETDLIMEHISLCSQCAREAVSIRYSHQDIVADLVTWADKPSVMRRVITLFRKLVSPKQLDLEIYDPRLRKGATRGVSSGLAEAETGIDAAPGPIGAHVEVGLASLCNLFGPVTGQITGGISRLWHESPDRKRRSQFMIGDPLLFAVPIPQDGHLVVVHFDGVSHLKLVFPLDRGQRTSVSKGEIIRIPGHVEGPPGIQLLKAIWTSKIVMDSIDIHLADSTSVESALENYMGAVSRLDSSDWSEALCEYEVIKE